MSKTEPPARPEAVKPATPGAIAPEGGAEAYARWLEHMQRSRGRHAAIARVLFRRGPRAPRSLT